MTLEDFAHRCLMIKAGNATLDIPCCANCEHYTKVVIGDEVRTNTLPGFRLINKSIKWECFHPALETDDAAWLETKPEDFCSRWESRNEQ